MVRSIGPIGKKAGLCARVPASRLQRRRAAAGAATAGPRPPWVPQQPLAAAFAATLGAAGAAAFRRGRLPWWSPWICWCRLSLPGLLSRGRPLAASRLGLVASLGWFYWGAIVSTWADANGNVADTTQIRAPSPLKPVRRSDQALLQPLQEDVLGRSMPMKTILLVRGSPSALGARSLPMSWCTPWKITLRPCLHIQHPL